MLHDKLIEYSWGAKVNTKVWQSRTEPWSIFVGRLTEEKRSAETMAEWAEWKKTDEGRKRRTIIKDVGGYVAAALDGGLRHPQNVIHRTMLTLDADTARPDLWDTFVMLFDCAAVMHQTHSWTPESPSLRLVVPLSRPVGPTLGNAISVHVANDLDAHNFDSTTHEINRLMFWPSLPSDAPHQVYIHDAEFLDVDAWVSDHPRWEDISTWPISEAEIEKLNREVKVLGDPREKEGMIGAFCRTYDIESAIDTFLYDVYTPGSQEDRYSLITGEGSNGLHLLDNGLHARSHHSSDVICNRTVNAFDLVRIHKFGEGTGSMNEMYRLCEADPGVIEELDNERGHAAEVFAETGEANPRGMFFRIEIGSRTPVFTPRFVADWYIGLQPVAVMNGELYRYDSGRYVRATEHFRRQVAVALGVEYTPRRVADSLSCLLDTAPVIVDPFGDGYLNVKNGLLDMRTGALTPHTPSHYSTVQIPWDYNPEATCPTIDRFLSEYAGRYVELVWYMMGYTLMNTMRFEKSFILYGEGGNGKGTTLSLITHMLGEENVSNVSLHKLESNTFAAAGVIGKMANIQSDLPAKILEAEGVFKQLTSGDRISVERKNKDAFSATPRAKLLFSTNEMSTNKDNSEGFYRRWCVIPFDKKFEDPNMRDRLFGEIEGMLARAVMYALELNTLDRFPGDGDVEFFRMHSDNVFAFIKEHLVADPEMAMTKIEVYDAYVDYCRCEGVFSVKQKTFNARLRRILSVTEPRTKSAKMWGGLRLVTDGDQR